MFTGTIYDPVTGEIKWHVKASSIELINAQSTSDVSVILGEYDPDDFIIVDGEAVKKELNHGNRSDRSDGSL